MDQRRSEGGSALEQYAVDLIDPSLTWRDVEWLKSITALPVVVKGIMTAEVRLGGAACGRCMVGRSGALLPLRCPHPALGRCRMRSWRLRTE